MNWKIFFATGIAVFMVVLLQRLGVHPQLIREAIPQTQESIINSILPKLQQKPNDFKLNRQSSLIQQAYAASAYDNAVAYNVVDFTTGNVIISKNIDKQLPIASLTKIMTAVVALDLSSPDAYFAVSQKAADEPPTKIGVIAGQRMQLRELLNAILLTSANDAAETVRDGIDRTYGQGAFIQAMNAKAQYIGLRNTHFQNPQGFDSPQQYSSVEDLSVLTHYALQNYPLIASIVQKDYQFLPADQYHKQFDLYNWNGLLDVYPNVLGVKIGNTDKAGYTTIVLSERDNKKVLTVLLGAPDITNRDLWASQLLDIGYEKIANLDPVNISEDQLMAKYHTWKYWN